MRNTLRILCIGLLAAVFTAANSGCILKEKVLQVVLSEEIHADFSEYHEGASWTNTLIVDYAQEVEDILNDAGYSRSDIDQASLRSASAGVLTLTDPGHDWTIGGAIEVRRLDLGGNFVTLINYTSVSLRGLLGGKQAADLDPNGVVLLNGALEDFINGSNPTLEFRVNNGSVSPTPSAQDPIEFEWRAFLLIQIVLTDTVEVPDPF